MVSGIAMTQTEWLLIAKYQGLHIIPAENVCRDFFPHLSRLKFLRKVDDGKIKLPLMRMEVSQKSAKGVDIRNPATYLDERRAEAQREFYQLHRALLHKPT